MTPARAPDPSTIAGPDLVHATNALTPADDRAILKLWGELHDTLQIAHRLNRPEAQIANRLAQLRDEDGTAMTPTQYALHHARKRRLARLTAAAAQVPQDSMMVRVAPRELGYDAGRSAGRDPVQRSPHPSSATRHGGLQGAPKPPSSSSRSHADNDLLSAPSARTIQHAVCAHYRVTLQDLLSPRRHAEIMRPRQVAVWLCRTLTALSMPKIGQLFGDRDHTTILAAIRKITELLPRDEDLRLDVEILTQQLRDGAVFHP